MAFDSFSALVLMDGHGAFVWTCYAAFFVLFGLVAWFSVWERRRVVRFQQRQQTLEAAGDEAAPAWNQAGGGFQRIPSTHNESVGKS